MRLSVNHVAEIYVTEQRRKIVPESDQCSVTYAEERHAVIFRDFNVAGCAETETYRQPNDDSETDSDDIEIVRAVLKRGEAAESDDNRTGLSRTLRCQMVLTARSLPMTRISMASAANT